jgi:hypothetical protein
MPMSEILVAAALWVLTAVTARLFWRSGSWISYAVSIFTAAVTLMFSGTTLIAWLVVLKAGAQ